MRSFSFIALTLGTLGSLAACSSFDPDLGTNPFLCGLDDPENPKCPSGYTCEESTELPPRQICVAEGAKIVDAAPSGFQCADDSDIETGAKNDTIATAYQTPVAMQRKSIPYVGLAVCPKGDKDLYAIHTTSSMQSIEIVVTWDSGQPISASLLNGGGTAINNGVSNGERSIRAFASALPIGTYYAQVFAGADTENNYNLNITVTP
ncbi:MAG: hypothetical protein AB7O24_14995 [Kofleriaceae bacterium]